MANLISIGGNWNTAASWGLIHSGSMQAAGATSTVWPNAAIGYGATWAGDNLEVDGVMMYFEYRSASPNGWMKVVLRNSTDSLDAATVTIDVADLPAIPISGDGGFYVFFKFASPVTLTTGKNFCIGIQAQYGTQVYGYKDATANNFNRWLRRTATAAPQASDSLWVVGENDRPGDRERYNRHLRQQRGRCLRRPGDWQPGNPDRFYRGHHSTDPGRKLCRHGGWDV